MFECLDVGMFDMCGAGQNRKAKATSAQLAISKNFVQKLILKSYVAL